METCAIDMSELARVKREEIETQVVLYNLGHLALTQALQQHMNSINNKE